MPVGIQPQVGQVNQQIGQIAINLRNACRDAANFQEWAVSTGLAGLETIGFTPGDAQSLLNMAGYLNTVAGIYTGQAAQTPSFNFDNALSGLWGGN